MVSFTNAITKGVTTKALITEFAIADKPNGDTTIETVKAIQKVTQSIQTLMLESLKVGIFLTIFRTV